MTESKYQRQVVVWIQIVCKDSPTKGSLFFTSHIFWNIWSLSYFLQDWLSEAFKRQTSIYQKTRNMRWTELLFFHFLQMTVFSFKRIEKKIVSLTSKSCSSNHLLIIIPNRVFRLAIFWLDWLWTLIKYLPLGPSLNVRA